MESELMSVVLTAAVIVFGFIVWLAEVHWLNAYPGPAFAVSDVAMFPKYVPVHGNCVRVSEFN